MNDLNEHKTIQNSRQIRQQIEPVVLKIIDSDRANWRIAAFNTAHFFHLGHLGRMAKYRFAKATVGIRHGSDCSTVFPATSWVLTGAAGAAGP